MIFPVQPIAQEEGSAIWSKINWWFKQVRRQLELALLIYNLISLSSEDTSVKWLRTHLADFKVNSVKNGPLSYPSKPIIALLSSIEQRWSQIALRIVLWLLEGDKG